MSDGSRKGSPETNQRRGDNFGGLFEGVFRRGDASLGAVDRGCLFRRSGEDGGHLGQLQLVFGLEDQLVDLDILDQGLQLAGVSAEQRRVLQVRKQGLEAVQLEQVLLGVHEDGECQSEEAGSPLEEDEIESKQGGFPAPHGGEHGQEPLRDVHEGRDPVRCEMLRRPRQGQLEQVAKDVRVLDDAAHAGVVVGFHLRVDEPLEQVKGLLRTSGSQV